MKVDLIDYMGSDLTIVNAARVSFDKASRWEDEEYGMQRLSTKDEKLIHYLADHKHFSPFGHCFVSLRVTAPVFVARQLVKHEYLRMNEVSRRYVDSEPEFFVPETWRKRAEDKKQGSGEAFSEVFWQQAFTKALKNHHRDSLEYYNTLIKDGVAPEQARMVLPQSMMTSWYWSGSLDAFANMYNLRAKEDTQYETRQIAKMIGDHISPLFPVSWGALTKETNHG